MSHMSLMDIDGQNIHVFHWQPDQEHWTELGHETGRPGPSIRNILSEEHFYDTAGISVLIFPPTAKIEKLDNAKDPLCEQLSCKFGIPSFFWTRLGWDANGFYGARQDPHRDAWAQMLRTTRPEVLRSHSSYSRYLVKAVNTPPARALTGQDKIERPGVSSSMATQVRYDWYYIGLYSVWLEFPNNEEDTNPGSHTKQILICFDFAQDLANSAAAAFRATTPRTIDNSPFGCHALFLDVLTDVYNDKLWGFRGPLRNFEKSRIQPMGLKNDLNYDEETVARSHSLRFENMHELERHIIHATETLHAAERTFQGLKLDIERFERMLGSSIGGIRQQQLTNTLLKVEFHTTFCANLKLRAQAFEDRLQNEIRHAFNAVATGDSSTARAQLQALKDQNSSLATTVSVLTLLFLPGSFISGFFGTNFFAISQSATGDTTFSYVPQLWIFFAVTVPITLICLAVYFLQKRYLGRSKRSKEADKDY